MIPQSRGNAGTVEQESMGRWGNTHTGKREGGWQMRDEGLVEGETRKWAII